MMRSPLQTKDEIWVMALIGTAHGTSHFFQLVLPPLFPFLLQEFSVSNTELGAMMTLFFLSSGLCQPVAGFLVDRFGAVKVLFCGLALYAVTIMACAGATAFWHFMPLVVIAGIGNGVFHPADFSILNASVRPARLGRAFSLHTLGGNLGWAAAPVLLYTTASLYSWRIALIVAGIIGLLVLLGLLSRHGLFRDSRDRQPATADSIAVRPTVWEMVAPLFSRPIVLCFTYFTLLAAGLIGVQNFLPATLDSLHGTSFDVASLALTGFLLGASLGVLCGGILADKFSQHTLIITLGLLGSAVSIASVGWIDFSTFLLISALSLAGFLSGVTTPSRDLLVRSATPRGATGRVFGVVYSGLDVGSALVPITIGWLLDQGRPEWVIGGIALFFLAAIGTAVSVQNNRQVEQTQTT